jgi:cold shock CspA family protein
MIKKGTVKFYHREYDYGFVVPADGGPDVYTRGTWCRTAIQKGDNVSYEEAPDSEVDGRIVAKNVTVIE